MSNIGCLTSILHLFLKLDNVYGRMTPDRRAKTKYFGIYSILTNVITAVFFVFIFWGILALLPQIDTSGLGMPLIVTFIAILGLCELVLIAQLILGGLMGIIYQRRCNSHYISWIALAVLVVSVAAMIFGVLYLMNISGVDW